MPSKLAPVTLCKSLSAKHWFVGNWGFSWFTNMFLQPRNRLFHAESTAVVRIYTLEMIKILVGLGRNGDFLKFLSVSSHPLKRCSTKSSIRFLSEELQSLSSLKLLFPPVLFLPTFFLLFATSLSSLFIFFPSFFSFFLLLCFLCCVPSSSNRYY